MAALCTYSRRAAPHLRAARPTVIVVLACNEKVDACISRPASASHTCSVLTSRARRIVAVACARSSPVRAPLQVAAKVAKPPESTDEAINVLREIECIATVTHPNIMPFLGACLSDAESCMLVTEFMTGGNLKEWLYGSVPGGRKPWRKLSERLNKALQVPAARCSLQANAPVVACCVLVVCLPALDCTANACQQVRVTQLISRCSAPMLAFSAMVATVPSPEAACNGQRGVPAYQNRPVAAGGAGHGCARGGGPADRAPRPQAQQCLPGRRWRRQDR